MNPTNSKGIVILVLTVSLLMLVVLAVTGFGNSGAIYEANRTSNVPSPGIVGNNQNEETGLPKTIASNLSVPWSVTFLPDGDLIMTERSGTLRVLGRNPVELDIPGVVERGEGGLLGLALHPSFSTNNYIYMYYTAMSGGQTVNNVIRYKFNGISLSEPYVVLDNITGNLNHNGGRIAFGPDGYLYIATGDAGEAELAQDTSSLAGKILRIADDGSIPTDNPFGNEVYSYGHRNPQGLAWDGAGGMWSVEHGRSGVLSGYDEINYIEKGSNYGWPVIQGDEAGEGMKTPVFHSGPSSTWAPADLAYNQGRLYFTGLRGQALYDIEVTGQARLGSLNEKLKNQYGRLRALAIRNNDLIFSTSNRDGRGEAASDDDRILNITIPSR